MQQWEYAILYMTGREQAQVMYCTATGKGRGERGNQYMLMHNMGQEGWQIAASLPTGKAMSYLMQRPVEPAPKRATRGKRKTTSSEENKAEAEADA